MTTQSQPDKAISKKELNRLARQWVELMLEQIQHQKDMNKKKD